MMAGRGGGGDSSFKTSELFNGSKPDLARHSSSGGYLWHVK